MAEDILCPSCKRKSVHIPYQVCRVILCFDCVVQNHGHFAVKETQDVQLVYKLCKSCNENKTKTPNKRESNEQPAKTAAPSTRPQPTPPESGKPETDAPPPPSTHHQGAIPKAKKPETVSTPPPDICPKCQNRMPVYRICEKCDRGHAYMCLDGDCWAISPAWLDPNKRSPSWVCSKCQQKPSATNPATTFVQVQDLIAAYQKLTEAANSVNDCFGLILLIIILGCLIHLLVTPYALYSIIFNTGNSMFIVSQSIWMTGHVLRLLLIVEPCHGCFVQSKNTSAVVCKLLCTESDKEIKKALEFFLAYLSQCRIEFTAFGLTKIHRGLLTTIAGAVTTYLVILFQFNKG